MPTITIDSQEVTVDQGQTLLDAAEKLGLEIPTLCFYRGLAPNGSCLACLMKEPVSGRLIPSCATVARDGMVLESQTDEVTAARKTAVELLLSDHVGDCMAPCQCICPAGMNIPKMLRHIAGSRVEEAVAVMRGDLPLAGVLGRLCTAPCENGCRRKGCDDPAAIQLLERFTADSHLAQEVPDLPLCDPPNGRSVAILGGGPLGLSAAYDLLRCGYSCTLFHEQDGPGGSLLADVAQGRLPQNVLDGEIDLLKRMGLQVGPIHSAQNISAPAISWQSSDTVLIDQSEVKQERLDDLGLTSDRLNVTQGRPVIFTSGNPKKQPTLIRSVAKGKQLAADTHRVLSIQSTSVKAGDFTVHIGKLRPAERAIFLEDASDTPRVQSAGKDLTLEQARAEASRCLHCDCHKADACRLRHVARQLQADPHRFGAERRDFERHRQHGEVLYEPGKCIDCGLCLQVTADAGEALGLTFVGRGFDVRVGVPFGEDLTQGLQQAGRRCVTVCPTGALAFKDTPSCPQRNDRQVIQRHDMPDED